MQRVVVVGGGVGGTLAANLKKNFGLDDKAVAFWTVHDVADEDHSGVGKELLSEFANNDDDRERVLEIVQETVDMTFLLYDGMHKRIAALA